MAIADDILGVRLTAEGAGTATFPRVHRINGVQVSRCDWVAAWHALRQADEATIITINGVRYDGQPARDKWMALVDSPQRMTIRCLHNWHMLVDPSLVLLYDDMSVLIDFIVSGFRRNCHRCDQAAAMLQFPDLLPLIVRARRWPEVAIYRSLDELAKGAA